jgi:hypothetical protein
MRMKRTDPTNDLKQLLNDMHNTGHTEWGRRVNMAIDDMMSRPIDMLLYCPRCTTQHIDAPSLAASWTNPPHRSHLCAQCGHIWRPADVATNGVARIHTQGKQDGDPQPQRQA